MLHETCPQRSRLSIHSSVKIEVKKILPLQLLFMYPVMSLRLLKHIVPWKQFLVILIVQNVTLLRSHVNANILNTVLGVPSECVHQTGVWPCKLSFSCWLQGGKHGTGCGQHKWLFSCCLGDEKSDISPTSNLIGSVLSEYARKKIVKLPMRVISKRRDDNELIAEYECGLQIPFATSLQKRIIGGHPARFAEYPWQAHIRIAEYQCGGVLVSNHFIATAAHCIMHARLQDIVVFLGELDTQNQDYNREPLPSEKHSISQKIIHPRFRFRMTQPDRFDLALLRLSKPVEFSEHILPICLPKKSIRLVGRVGLIAGWGKTEATLGHSGTNMLQTAAVPILSAAECIQWHKMKRIHVELFGEMFCAGHPDGHQDACLGDSGGPLVIRDRGRYTLVGITSAGFGCGIDYQPGIYHNIQKTTQWIHDVIRVNKN